LLETMAEGAAFRPTSGNLSVSNPRLTFLGPSLRYPFGFCNISCSTLTWWKLRKRKINKHDRKKQRCQQQQTTNTNQPQPTTKAANAHKEVRVRKAD